MNSGEGGSPTYRVVGFSAGHVPAGRERDDLTRGVAVGPSALRDNHFDPRTAMKTALGSLLKSPIAMRCA